MAHQHGIRTEALAQGGIMPRQELVTYFSATGTTAKLAARIAGIRGCEAVPILPKVPYSVADLNWGDTGSRSSLEMGDDSCRPELEPLERNLADYGVIFCGYPIWWGQEPRVIDSFLEGNDFTGKIIVPFATSGGSDMGSSPARIQALTPGSTVRGARLLSVAFPDEVLGRWLGELQFE